MKRKVWIGLVLVVLASLSAIWFFEGYILPPPEAGFRIYSLQDDALLISDDDILLYNWNSQEMAITPQASERLTDIENLYSWTGFVIKIDGDELYRGIFRNSYMSAIPGSPSICILFPSLLFPSTTENYGAMRMFFPFFQPPGEKAESNARLHQYFEKVNKLR